MSMLLLLKKYGSIIYLLYYITFKILHFLSLVLKAVFQIEPSKGGSKPRAPKLPV